MVQRILKRVISPPINIIARAKTPKPSLLAILQHTPINAVASRMRDIAACHGTAPSSATKMASVTTKLSFLVLAAIMMSVGGVITLLRILWAILTRPLTVFKKVPRNGERNKQPRPPTDPSSCVHGLPFSPTLVPPGCLLDRSLGSHEYVTANGIKFHYVTAGDRSKPLMLFLHGFPEVATNAATAAIYLVASSFV